MEGSMKLLMSDLPLPICRNEYQDMLEYVFLEDAEVVNAEVVNAPLHMVQMSSVIGIQYCKSKGKVWFFQLLLCPNFA